jgi:ABC-2 type transport system permease protein
MMSNLRAALVIARRDYVATVWSRAFILFLIGPLIPIIFGLTFGSVGAKMQKTEPPVIAILATPAQGQALVEARGRLTDALGGNVLPEFAVIHPHRDESRQGADILSKGEASAVLSGLPDAPTLRGSRDAVNAHGPEIEWILNEVDRDAALKKAGIAPASRQLARVAVAEVARPVEADRAVLARAAQLLLLFLTMILAGMLLSNMLEEKSSKVIEILAAAVPVDAIFMGKLIAMLGMSLTGITIWSAAAAGAVAIFAPGVAVQITAPAVGWPIFVMLCVVYFMASYLLLGALFLGIGAQAGTVREVQTLSMPLTFGQLIVFGFASVAAEHPDSPTAIAASVFPWSSPFAMIARSVLRAELWPHLLAIAWQMLAVTLIIRIGARLFRRSVLKSGGGGFWRRLIGRSSRTA